MQDLKVKKTTSGSKEAKPFPQQEFTRSTTLVLITLKSTKTLDRITTPKERNQPTRLKDPKPKRLAVVQ